MTGPLTLLLVPGLGLTAEAWAPTLDALQWPGATQVRHLPGYGEPAPAGTDLSVDRLAAALRADIPDSVERTVVVGHSASCQVAAHLARAEPSRVVALVLVGPTTDPRAADWGRLAGRWLATARHETLRQVPALARQYRRTTLRTMARTMDAARRDRIAETLRDTTAPVLAIRGRHDRIAPEDWTRAVAGLGGPGSRSLTLPSGGHMVPITDGRSLATAITSFVDEVVATR